MKRRAAVANPVLRGYHVAWLAMNHRSKTGGGTGVGNMRGPAGDLPQGRQGVATAASVEPGGGLPQISAPERLQGLYAFDFGEWTSVGYTLEEIAVLLDSEAYADGKVYQIVRASPDGRLELKGISPSRFRLESGMFFQRDELAAARNDFQNLLELSRRVAPPCRCFVHLADRGPLPEVPRYMVALVYPSEYEDAMARWLLEADYRGGDTVEGGPSHVSNYYEEAARVLERESLFARTAFPSRSADEVLATVRRVMQR
jgi:hypothetical protein